MANGEIKKNDLSSQKKRIFFGSRGGGIQKSDISRVVFYSHFHDGIASRFLCSQCLLFVRKCNSDASSTMPRCPSTSSRSSSPTSMTATSSNRSTLPTSRRSNLILWCNPMSFWNWVNCGALPDLWFRRSTFYFWKSTRKLVIMVTILENVCASCMMESPRMLSRSYCSHTYNAYASFREKPSFSCTVRRLLLQRFH